MSSDDKELRRLRDHIDKADEKIVEALKERMDVVEEIRRYKKEHELEPHDEERAEEILETRVNMGGKLSGEFLRELFRLIIKESERLQK